MLEDALDVLEVGEVQGAHGREHRHGERLLLHCIRAPSQMSDRDKGLGMEKRVVLVVYIDHWLLMSLMKRSVPLYPSFPFAVSFLSVTPREEEGGGETGTTERKRRRRKGEEEGREQQPGFPCQTAYGTAR